MAKRKTDFDKAEFEEQVNAMSHYERYDEFQARGLSPSGIVTDIDSSKFTVSISVTPAEVKKAIVEDMMKSSKKRNESVNFPSRHYSREAEAKWIKQQKGQRLL
jgi:hypothetical protein